MNIEVLPIQYRLEIYERSFVNDPVISFRSPQPFQSFQKGDFLDTSHWADLIDALAGTPHRITEINHCVWQVGESCLRHQVGLCIEPAEWL